MKKLHLHIDKMIQGDFRLKKLNLLLMFQVNCPGCFTHALPAFNQLYEKFNGLLGFIALSTAFEDFDLNTQENTYSLINERELIGETKKVFFQNGYKELPYEPLFPVGMDTYLIQEQKEELAENICLTNPNFRIWPEYDQNLIRKKVLDYLDNQQQISLTFTANQFKGTPTIALFNDQKELLHSWFGHNSIEEVIHKIRPLIN